MILFFGSPSDTVFAVQVDSSLSAENIAKLRWLFGGRDRIDSERVDGQFVGPRAAMITPWSTNAVEITQNMAIDGIRRIERFAPFSAEKGFDPMLSQKYAGLHQEIFRIDIKPEPIRSIEDIAAYNETEGLALSEEEIAYLEEVAQRIGRKLTDSEVFGFSQINSEHCRHKIFNGTFVIDGAEMPHSLFSLIKKTSKAHPNSIVSAYKDNVAFLKGPKVRQFTPKTGDKPDYYERKDMDSVVSLKAETHNFPTTVEPFNGAATGSGGEIRDRMAGGKGSLPLAGTAVYMTSYSRLREDRPWEKAMPARPWLYQTPMDILIKASNGASDFGNKFGQPLIAGSLLTFEHEEHARKLGFDKVIMLAGGVGSGKESQALKDAPQPGDKIVLLGGDNYRIGMGGAAVSSADTGAFSSGIELNAVQRSNPEMQKRVANTIRALVDSGKNPIVAIHDHGAGGHLNCFSELVEETGGKIDIDQLPVGDPTLSMKEIIGNESQERMGLIVSPEDLDMLRAIAERERAPMYVVGEVTGDSRFVFESSSTGEKPMDLALEDMFGSSPKTIMDDQMVDRQYEDIEYEIDKVQDYLEAVLRLEAVACKDWLTNKVDRCVGGLVAKQQCTGPLQLPLNDVGVMALGFDTTYGVATSIGHAPVNALIDPAAGSRNAVAEALTNLVWAPLEEGIKSVSLSANWMWPCRNEGEDARLYQAVEAASEFCIALGVNIPTGKDSLSMKQKYPKDEVLAPGTVIISSVGVCDDIRSIVEPVFQRGGGSIYYVNLSVDHFKLGGSSFAQVNNKIGSEAPDVTDPEKFAATFNAIQQLIHEGKILAGHDVSAGGLITTLLEMCFADKDLAADIDLSGLSEADTIKLLFSENSGLVFQLKDDSLAPELATLLPITCFCIGQVREGNSLTVLNGDETHNFDIPALRDIWYETSWLLDQKQTANGLADERYKNYKDQPLRYQFPEGFNGTMPAAVPAGKRPKAAVLREKGSNSERELAHAMYLAGFDVRDVHMTDLISGRETLEDIQFLGAVGGFSNSDVLGSAKGWAGAFLYNEKARKALENFYAREDVLSVGICNGCQLLVELGLINPAHQQKPHMDYNESHKHESGFTSVEIQENNSVMLSSLSGSKLGVWISHGEGKFDLPLGEDQYNIVAKYGYEGYPANPNGSDYNTAMMASADGRHLVLMPHIERSIFPWNWANYPKDRTDEISPWIQAFVNAREWLEKR
ncbi:phosphoribosylformylglycinamidine synthase [Flavilitoribacter nigricans]|uniref:Phosphoribosylformylglycinamidine synthase n=1 Tax=Flavilitoribacter nigricans (strain ATCC 23147 / DSM 23189 / NBRC 102662 / NCIMB 1420 / SS-2) TaxID=1122177 RepID=A0A2D0NIF3_FLAN2|nr:phosphoribosylformylglycinamidine synthase [Flavilitoribacter nigricans]PHN08227.1 phosphoribosylformylglycinamidine synthase [Flavilitoribacter nigricans DSM 23189 = NBRC 102662]